MANLRQSLADARLHRAERDGLHHLSAEASHQAEIGRAEARGYATAVAVVRRALEAAQSEPRPWRPKPDDVERRVGGTALDVASRAGRITALGALLADLETVQTDA